MGRLGPLSRAAWDVHTLSPGMVFTDLLLNDSTPELRKFPFGVLAAQPPEVAQDLIPKILATTGNGKKVEFLTTDRCVAHASVCQLAAAATYGKPRVASVLS